MGSGGGTQVAAMFASLGLKVDDAQWAIGKQKIMAMSSLAAQRERAQQANSAAAAKSAAVSTRAQQAQVRAAQQGNAMIAQARNSSTRAQAKQYLQSQSAMAKAAQASQASHKGLLSTLGGVKSSLLSVQTAIGGYVASLGLHSAYDHLIGFNEEIQNAKISLSAMLQGNMGGSWEQAKTNAENLYLEFQKFSTTTPVTTKEILEFGRGVAVATFQAGGSIKDLTTITEMGTVAAKTLGANSQYAALELTLMLQGTVSHRMRFVQQLLGLAHVSMEQFRAMNAKQRLATVTGVLTSGPMQRANQEMAASFTGVTSTLWDKLQIALGKVGLPLFQALTAAVAGINVWLERNAETIDRIGKAVGTALADGFAVIKDLAMQVYGVFERNRDVIMRLIGLVGMNLVEALKMMVDWLGAGLKAAETILKFLDTGTGKFITMLAMTPGLLLEISEAVGGLGDMFDALAKSSAIQVLLFLAEKLDDLFGGGGGEGGGDMDELARARSEYIARKSGTEFWNTYDARPSLALPSGAMQGGAGGVLQTRSVSVSVGDIHVHSPSADPAAVATETRKQLDAHLTDLFRQTHDVVAGSR